MSVYMNNILLQAKLESHLSHLGYPPLSLYLLMHNVFVEDVVFDIHMAESVKVEETQGKLMLQTIREMERLLRQYFSETLVKPLEVGLTLVPDELDVVLFFDLPDDVKFGDSGWGAFYGKVKALGGEISVVDEDQYLECAVRISHTG